MYVHAFGRDYYLDEKKFAERMAAKKLDGPPWRMEEIIAIQHQMKESEDRIFEHVQRTATPDPVKALQDHLNELCEREGK